jgi:hypothetical protein
MKKTFIKLGVCLLAVGFLLSPTVALAERAAPETAETAETSKEVLKIDNKNRYEGMGSSYGKGYMPVVKNGKVAVRLPLIASEAIVGNKITATPDFGDLASSPFTITNVQKTVRLMKHSLPNGKQVTAYLLIFDVPLKKSRAGGQYPLIFRVDYYTSQGYHTQQFAVYVTVKDGKDPNIAATTEASVTSEKPLSQPKIMIERYRFSPNPAVAGQSLDLSVTLRNTNSKQAIQNIKVSLRSQGDVIPSSGSGSQYIKTIGKSGSHTLAFELQVRTDAKPEPQKLSLQVEYEDSKANAIAVEEEIIVEVRQPIKLEMDKPNIPEKLNAGDNILVTMGVFNMGKGMVNNVMCKLSVPGLLPESSVFLGNMEGGESKSCEFSVSVGTRDMTVSEDENMPVQMSDEEKYGQTSGKIIVTYEDEFGAGQTKEIDISTEIIRPVIAETTPDTEEKPKTVSQWWISIVIAAVIIVALTMAILIGRRRSLKKVADDADD